MENKESVINGSGEKNGITVQNGGSQTTEEDEFYAEDDSWLANVAPEDDFFEEDDSWAKADLSTKDGLIETGFVLASKKAAVRVKESSLIAIKRKFEEDAEEENVAVAVEEAHSQETSSSQEPGGDLIDSYFKTASQKVLKIKESSLQAAKEILDDQLQEDGTKKDSAVPQDF